MAKYPDDPTGACKHGVYGPACTVCNPFCEHGVSNVNSYDPCMVCAAAVRDQDALEDANDGRDRLRRENEELREENDRLKTEIRKLQEEGRRGGEASGRSREGSGVTGGLKHERHN